MPHLVVMKAVSRAVGA